jgi:hypothetical protein
MYPSSDISFDWLGGETRYGEEIVFDVWSKGSLPNCRQDRSLTPQLADRHFFCTLSRTESSAFLGVLNVSETQRRRTPEVFCAIRLRCPTLPYHKNSQGRLGRTVFNVQCSLRLGLKIILLEKNSTGLTSGLTRTSKGGVIDHQRPCQLRFFLSSTRAGTNFWTGGVSTVLTSHLWGYVRMQ